VFLNLTAVIENSVTAFLIISAFSQRSLRLCGDLLGTPKANRRAAENAEEREGERMNQGRKRLIYMNTGRGLVVLRGVGPRSGGMNSPGRETGAPSAESRQIKPNQGWKTFNTQHSTPNVEGTGNGPRRWWQRHSRLALQRRRMKTKGRAEQWWQRHWRSAPHVGKSFACSSSTCIARVRILLTLRAQHANGFVSEVAAEAALPSCRAARGNQIPERISGRGERVVATRPKVTSRTKPVS
jgi:hypothetical protein